MKKKFNAIIEKTETGFSSYISDLGVFTTGRSLTELRENLKEALELLFEDEENFEVSLTDIEMQFDLQQFFQYYRVINASFLADKIGMNPTLLSQYVQGSKKPSQKQTERILKGVQEIGLELSQLNLVR